MIYVISLQKSLIKRLDQYQSGSSEGSSNNINTKAIPSSAKYEDDGELVAVIAAAVAEYLDKPLSQLVIRSIKRTGGQGDPWATAGRQDLMGSRLN